MRTRLKPGDLLSVKIDNVYFSLNAERWTCLMEGDVIVFLKKEKRHYHCLRLSTMTEGFFWDLDLKYMNRITQSGQSNDQ